MRIFVTSLPSALGLSMVLGCQSAPEEPEGRPPSPHQAKPLISVSYERSCLGSKRCAEMEQIAAAVDYAAAVYGNSDAFKYDGRLSKEERVYVERRGKLPNRYQDLVNFLNRHQRRFLKVHKEPNRGAVCHNTHLFEFVSVSHDKWGQAYSLGGVHSCGEVFGSLYLRKGIELAVAAKPEDWVFFIEKTSRHGTSKKFEEYALFQRIAKTLKIPLYNPIVSIRSDAVIDVMKQKHSTSRLKFASYFILGLIRDQLEHYPQLAHLTERQLIEYAYENLTRIFVKNMGDSKERQALIVNAGKFKVEPDRLMASCASIIKSVARDLDPPTAFEREFNRVYSEMKTHIAKISNDMSAEHVKKTLKEEKKPRAFFQVGKAHLPIVAQIYQGKDNKSHSR